MASLRCLVSELRWLEQMWIGIFLSSGIIRLLKWWTIAPRELSKSCQTLHWVDPKFVHCHSFTCYWFKQVTRRAQIPKYGKRFHILKEEVVWGYSDEKLFVTFFGDDLLTLSICIDKQTRKRLTKQILSNLSPDKE